MGTRDPRDRYRAAAANTFGASLDEPLAVEDGYRMAATVLGEWAAWLCPHVHPSHEAARACLRDAGCEHDVHFSDEIVEKCLRARGFTFPAG
jgi:hypothetical protein